MEYKWEWWWNENATKQKSTEKRYEEKETQSFGCSNHLMWCIFVCNVKRYGTWIAGEFDCMVLLCFVLQFFYLASGLTLNYYHQKSAIKCWLMHSNLSKSKYLLSGVKELSSLRALTYKCSIDFRIIFLDESVFDGFINRKYMHNDCKTLLSIRICYIILQLDRIFVWHRQFWLADTIIITLSIFFCARKHSRWYHHNKRDTQCKR